MADEFNLVPTNNLEKHLDNILRTAQGGESQYDLAPNWRVERYLDAIASALASCGVNDVLVVGVTGDNTRTLDKTWQKIYDAKYSVLVVKQIRSTSNVQWDVYPVKYAYQDVDGDEKFHVYATTEQADLSFVADTANDYPVEE